VDVFCSSLALCSLPLLTAKARLTCCGRFASPLRASAVGCYEIHHQIPQAFREADGRPLLDNSNCAAVRSRSLGGQITRDADVRRILQKAVERT
jgi:hypothetical protein